MSEDAPQLVIERRGRAGLVTLNRPGALNALTLDMVRELDPLLRSWAEDDGVDRVIVDSAGDRAFCAGGDIRALYDWGRAGDPRAVGFYREEYRLNALIKRYPKPYIALMDGITMGGGVGLSVHGSHRIATDRLTFAMPETGIGLFPDVGGTYFLPRLPGETGLYLGLTGARLKAADAIYCGISDAFVPSERISQLRTALIDTRDPDAAIAEFSQDVGDAPIEFIQDEIGRCFADDSVEAIVGNLDRRDTDWTSKTRGIIAAKSPTSLKITCRQIREGVSLDFEDCIRLEYRMVNRVMAGHDFYEGTRAVVIDKDQTPAWRPASLEEVGDDDVDGYFAPLEEELEL